MSYTKKTWQTGDTVTSSALNNMEGGIDAATNPFIVTLTPTAEDFSGVMDKTTAEINAAFEAGRKIVFSVPQLNGEVFNADTSIACDTTGGGRYLTAYIINTSNNILIVAWNSLDEESNVYHTAIYTLTPMS